MATRQQSAGRFGEDYTASYLMAEGWTVLDRNWHSTRGELDIVACKGETLAMVEVKARKQKSVVSGENAVTPAKRKKLVLAAADYLLAKGYSPEEWYLRFDIAEVTVSAVGELKTVAFRYLDNAFAPSDVGEYW